MYYPLGRLNVGGYRGIEAGGDGGNGGRLGHFTQIAWILQIAHTSRNVTAVYLLPPSPFTHLPRLPAPFAFTTLSYPIAPEREVNAL